MALEHEVKLAVPAHEPLRRRLAELKADYLDRVVEHNRIFDRPDGSLRRRGCGLRVRRNTSADGHAHSATMTFKGPVQGGPIKSREELEIEVNDAEEAARLLGGLGFVVILDYEKRRESWRMGDCQVELDEPPHVGLFVEIEGPRDGIRQTQERLGLGDVPHTPESYVQMLLSFSERNGLRGRPLRLT